jgi:hypothetical protein
VNSSRVTLGREDRSTPWNQGSPSSLSHSIPHVFPPVRLPLIEPLLEEPLAIAIQEVLGEGRGLGGGGGGRFDFGVGD